MHGWVERNMDRVPESFSSTLATSTHKVTAGSSSKSIDERMIPIDCGCRLATESLLTTSGR